MSTLTAVNSVLMLSIAGLYPTPQQIQGFATDDAFATDDVDTAETMMGVDGRMSAGFTPFITPLTISIQADSPSLIIFENWLAAQKAARDTYTGAVTILLPAISRKYAFTNGVLVKAPSMPGVKKLLEAVKYTINFERCEPASV